MTGHLPLINHQDGKAPNACGLDLVRLGKRAQFLHVRHGLTERRKSLLVQARARRGEDGSAIPNLAIGEGFTATKKIGNAVVRNRAKRRLRAASAQLLPRLGLGGVDYVFIARQHTGAIDWHRLLDDMESALVRLRGAIAEP